SGKWKPSLEITCAPNSGEFQIGGEQLHFFSGQNTLETANGEKLFSIARAGDFRLIAATDGKLHGMRAEQAFTAPGWGSDIASLGARCSPNSVVASGPTSASDSLTAIEIAGPNPRAISDPLPLQGSVTALWPANGGALAVVHETALGRY